MKLNGLKPVIQKRDEAVSPIIATILLVAITVILASTLYLALGGFF
ncbi:MAG: type IV pilin, partial [Candidatus Thermoplasmatota archaeon]|nr:type IV pilin [Candidatus Thermoplasmatota archaeon]